MYEYLIYYMITILPRISIVVVTSDILTFRFRYYLRPHDVAKDLVITQKEPARFLFSFF